MASLNVLFLVGIPSQIFDRNTDINKPLVLK